MGSKRTTPHPTKQQQFLQYRKGNRNVALLGGVALVLVGIAVYVALVRSKGPAAEPQAVTEVLPTGGDVRLPVSLFADGQAHFYRYTASPGREVRFFVLRGSDGVVRAAFDACDVCYRERKGYHQEGDDMVCNNCGRHFRSLDINVITGGCNPVPVQRSIDGGDVVLKASDLDSGRAYF